MSFTLKNWNGEAAKKLLKMTQAQRIEVACVLLKNEIKEAVSEPSPPVSDPGEPAHKDTGRYRASWAHEVDKEKLEGRVGSNMALALWLELGTQNMAARPVLRTKYNEHLQTLLKIIKGE
jgi:hypothetical protein